MPEAEEGESGRGDHEGLAHHLREKAISLNSMERPLRWLTVLALVQIVVAALLIALRQAPWPPVRLGGDGLGGGGSTEAPAVAVAFTVWLLIVGWSYVLAGALHAHGALRLLVVAVYSVFALTLALADHTAGVRVVLCALVVVWALSLGLWLLDRHYQRKGSDRHHRHRLKPLTFVCYFALTAICFLAGPLTGTGIGELGYLVSFELLVLEVVATPVLFLAGTDFAEWGGVAAGQLARVATPLIRDRGLALVALAAAVLALVQLAVTAGLRGSVLAIGADLPSLVMAAAFGWFAIRREAGHEVAFWPLLVVALLQLAEVYAAAIVAILGHNLDPEAAGLAEERVLIQVQYQLLPWSTAMCLAVLAGAMLLLRRGGKAASAGLFIAVAGAWFLELYPDRWLRPLLSIGPLDNVPQQTLGGAQAAAALVLLVLAGAVLARRRGLVTPMRLLLVLVLGIEVLRWMFDLYRGAMAVSDRFTAAQAVVLVLATLWDVAMSGENVTNVKGRHVPRHARVLIYFGYTTLVVATVLYFASRFTVRGHVPVPSLIENDALAQNGLLFLGLPLLITFFFLNLGAWLRDQRGPEVETVDRTELSG